MTEHERLEQYLKPEVPPPTYRQDDEDYAREFQLYFQARVQLAASNGLTLEPKGTKATPETTNQELGGRMLSLMAV